MGDQQLNKFRLVDLFSLKIIFFLIIRYGFCYIIEVGSGFLDGYYFKSDSKYCREFIVLILYGNSEIGAHVRNNLCYLIRLRHLIRSRAVTHLVFFSENTDFPSYVRNIV